MTNYKYKLINMLSYLFLSCFWLISSNAVIHTEFEVKRYSFHGREKLSWFEAIQRCSEENMDLVSPETRDENEFVIKSIRNLDDMRDKDIWTSGRLAPDGSWVWTSVGIPFEYFDWVRGFSGGSGPVTGSGEWCVGFLGHRGLKWGQFICNTKLYFICESRGSEIGSIDDAPDTTKSSNVRTVTLEPEVPSYSNAVPMYDELVRAFSMPHRVYYFFLGKMLGWDAARENCIKNELRLATIDHPYQNKKITDYVYNEGLHLFRFWMGGRRLPGNNRPWLWWDTDRNVMFSDWAAKQSNVSFGFEDCLTVIAGKWFSEACANEHYIICEGPPPSRIQMNTQQNEENEDFENPIGGRNRYMVARDVRTSKTDEEFHVSENLLSWQNAWNQCRSKDMFLVGLYDNLDNKNLYSLLIQKSNSKKQSFWTSGVNENGIWIWKDIGSPFNLNEWSAGDDFVTDIKDNIRDRRHCLSFSRGVEWMNRNTPIALNTKDCMISLPYICKKHHLW